MTVCLTAVAAAPAQAVLPGHARVGYDTTTPASLDYTAAVADGVASNLTVNRRQDGAYVFTDPNEILVPGTGCIATSTHVVACHPPAPPMSNGVVGLVQIFPQGAADVVDVDIPTEVVIDGGTGADRLTVKQGAGIIEGEAGADVITGGPRRDFLNGDRKVANGHQRKGDGADTVSGGPGADTISGGGLGDTIHGGSGNDSISGGDGNDQVFGDPGGDHLHGDRGDDTIHGGLGNDRLMGDTGKDTLLGEGGRDGLHGGAGDDVLHSRDNAQDSDFCEGGTDKAFVDHLDAVSNCETTLVA
jgi:hypothetical protein